MSKRGLVVDISSKPIYVEQEPIEWHGREHWPPGGPRSKLVGLRSRGIPENTLRAWLLYWDELAAADSYTPTIRTDDEQFLIDSQFLKLIKTSSSSMDGERAEQFAAFQDLERLEPGLWCMASEEAASNIEISAQPMQGRVALIRLYNVFPIPERETPFADILEFKERRKDELITLRMELEDMYQRIINSDDPAAAFATETDRLGQAVKDVVAATKESGWRLRFGGIETRIKWELDPKWFVAGAAGGGMLAGPLGAIIGSAVGLVPKVEFSSRAALERSPRRKTPYEYVALARREFGSVTG